MLDYKPRPQDLGHLIEERTKLFDNATAILDKCSIENRAPTLAEEREIRKAEDTSPGSELDNLNTTIAEFQARQKQIASLAPMMGMGNFGSEYHYNPTANKGLPNMNTPASFKAFKGPNAAQDAFDAGKWLRSVVNGDIRATATEGVPSQGGYVVPTPLHNAIINARELAGVSRKVAHVIPMTSDSLDVPKKTDGPMVYYPAEAGAITASDQTWGSVALTAKKRAILSYVSQELVDDSIIPIMDDLASQMGTEFAVQEDNEFINGDGTGTYGSEVGLLSAIHASAVATAAAGIDTWAELTIANHTDAMGKLNSKWWPYGTSWICSAQYYYQVMLRLIASAGGNAIRDMEAGAAGIPMFLGMPVHFTSAMPTSTAVAQVSALFGAFNQAVIIGDRVPTRIALSDQFAFDTDRLALRATTRYDINVHESTATGPYVGLKTAAS